MRYIVYFLLSLQILKAQQNQVISKNAMVVSARKEASEIGIQIMKKGGNAFDAMISVELALAVCYPYAGNIGGGGLMTFRLKNGTVGTLDYREKAPLKAHKNMYLDEKGEVIPKLSQNGALAVGVPGTIAGIYDMHQKYGKLSWKEVVEPAIQLAKKGVIVTLHDLDHISTHLKTIQSVNKEKNILDNNWKVGDTIKYLALAKTLEIIQLKGKSGFYDGEIAQKLCSFIQQNGGIISLEDLKKYETKWRKPIQFNYKKLKIYSMAPPSSGGIVLGQILKMVEKYPLKKYGHNSEKYIQIISEAAKRAFADRYKFMGDADFIKFPINELLDKNYLKSRFKNFDFKTASKEIFPGEISGFESMETTHYSIVDSEGNAVAATTTLNGGFGSKLFSNELGFFLNNEMDDFSIKTGTKNLYGLIGAKANEIAPEKRPLSSMTPTIIEKDGKLWMVLGAPGGSTIITSVLQNILNVYEFKMKMQESVSKKRFHHQWFPDEIKMEPNGFSNDIISNLKTKGYTVKIENNIVIGKVDAILVNSDSKLEAGADPRGDDAAVGY